MGFAVLSPIWMVLLCCSTVGSQDLQKDFKVECIRPLGIRVTPSPDFRIIQTGCRGENINVPLEQPYDVTPDCLVVTATGTAVQIILEESTSTINLVGGFQSRVFLVSCDFPGSKSYKDTFNRDVEAIKQPAGLDPTATSGVFKFTGVLMSIINEASFTARQWAEHLASSAFIGQELYLTISHPQQDEGQAFIIPRTCRVRPDTGNFTTIWHHDSTKERCLEVSGISRDPVRVFSDVSTATDVMSLQFYGFQFLGHEEEVITFECDVLLCGDVTSGSCGEEWTKLTVDKVCVTNKPPPLPRATPTNPPGKQRRRRRKRRKRQVPLSSFTADNIMTQRHNTIYRDSRKLTRWRRQAVSISLTNGNHSGNSNDHNRREIVDSSSSSNNNTPNNNNNNNNENNRAKNSLNKSNDIASGNARNTIRTAMPSTTPSSSSNNNIYVARDVVQEETVRVEIRMLMPRAKLTHMGTGSRLLPSTIVAILLAITVRALQDG